MARTTEGSARPAPWRKPGRLYEEVARDLGERIVRGEFAPGDFLPTEPDLVDRYGASRNVVREAVKLLSGRGLVEVLHGRGSRILPYEEWGTEEQLVRLVREDPEVPQNLLELRRILEVEIARLAARRAEPQQLEAMWETVELMRHGKPEDGMEHDLRFHRLLAEATGNKLLPLVMEPVEPLLRANREATIHDNPGVLKRSIEAHEKILAYVEAGDEEGARTAMRGHMDQVEGEVRKMQP
jgi:GntR family transcriptional repressor for pyruvate dehydrogenase complex